MTRLRSQVGARNRVHRDDWKNLFENIASRQRSALLILDNSDAMLRCWREECIGTIVSSQRPELFFDYFRDTTL